MGQAVKLAEKPRLNANRCVASLAFVIFLAAAFWTGVMWIAGTLIHLGHAVGG
jgi:hypothetical protein